MADKVFTLDMNHIEKGDVTGKIVNVYDTYAHAVAHGSTGLQTVKAVDPTDGSVGSAISQTAKTAGPEVDINGRLNIALDDGTASYYLMSNAGRFGGPMRVDATQGS